jgi:hypothetical protein
MQILSEIAVLGAKISGIAHTHTAVATKKLR